MFNYKLIYLTKKPSKFDGFLKKLELINPNYDFLDLELI